MRKSKMISIIACVLSMLILMSNICYADDAYRQDKATIYDEYEMVVHVRETNTSTLLSEGYSAEIINIVKSDALENVLLERKELEDKELKNDFGYTDDQIIKLKNYNGEAVQNTPELQSLLGKCTGQINCFSASKSQIGIQLSWNWTTQPVLSGPSITDAVAASWKGTNSNGAPINVALVKGTSYSFCELTGYDNGKTKKVRSDISVQDIYGKIYKKFNMTLDGSTYWVKNGIIQLTLKKTGADDINEVAMGFAYGHSNIGANLEISFPSGINITFGSKVDRIIFITNRIKSNGSVI